MKRIICAAIVASVLSGCATAPPPPTYTSSALFANLDCNQLAAESMRVERAAQTQLAAKQGKDNMNGAAVVVGVLLFWPALFFIQSSAAEAAEINRLRADAEAIVTAAEAKKCAVSIARPMDPLPVEDRKPVSCVIGTTC